MNKQDIIEKVLKSIKTRYGDEVLEEAILMGINETTERIKRIIEENKKAFCLTPQEKKKRGGYCKCNHCFIQDRLLSKLNDNQDICKNCDCTLEKCKTSVIACCPDCTHKKDNQDKKEGGKE